MGPKNTAVMCPTIPLKELSWIDRMYQKLEDICVEVDKNPTLLIQETSKYVESQMNVVGSNVKKLCAELIHDLLPPPIEKKFDCPLHCKCDCTDSEKPKQKEAGVQLFKETESVQTTDENFPAVNLKHCEIGDIELKNFASVKMLEQNIDANSTMIMNEVKNLKIEVSPENGEQFAKPAFLLDTNSQGNERDSIFVSQTSVSKRHRKQDDISKDEHVGSYSSGEESELKKKLEDICGRDTVAHNGEQGRMLLEDRIFQMTMEQEETETADALLRCSNLSFSDTTHEEPDFGDLVEELLVSEMNDDVMPMYGSTASTNSAGTNVKSVYSSTASLTLIGEKLDERFFLENTTNFVTNGHHASPQGENYMMVSASNDGDEEQSARWLVSESERNIFQHHENSPFNKGPNHLEEFESDWEFV